MSENIDINADLQLLDDELEKIQDDLSKVDASRTQLIQRLHQVSGAAAYLRGKLPKEEVSEEEKPEDKTTEENSEA
tara:strand:+ start:181 stop:408 length:228 start_codon:yes stop_codon:yes gene_type:complete